MINLHSYLRCVYHGDIVSYRWFWEPFSAFYKSQRHRLCPTCMISPAEMDLSKLLQHKFRLTEGRREEEREENAKE